MTQLLITHITTTLLVITIIVDKTKQIQLRKYSKAALKGENMFGFLLLTLLIHKVFLLKSLTDKKIKIFVKTLIL